MLRVATIFVALIAFSLAQQDNRVEAATPVRAQISRQLAFEVRNPCSFVACPQFECIEGYEKVKVGCCDVCKPICRYEYQGNGQYGCTDKCPGDESADCLKCVSTGYKKCECVRPCEYDGTVYQHGAWLTKECSNRCQCLNGEITCPCERRRKEIRKLSTDELNTFHQCMDWVKNSSFYDIYTLQHNDNFGNAHGVSAFWPWHRHFLLQLENKLRECDCSITLPYWDWTKDAAAPWTSPVFNPNYFGGSGSGSPHCLQDGPYSGWEDPNGNCLTRTFGPSGSFYSAAQIATYQATANTYSDLQGFIEGSPHGGVHVWMGGQMVTGISPSDPLFYLHHAFVDKIWADWQDMDPAHKFDYPTPNLDMIPFNTKPSAYLDMEQLGICYIESNIWIYNLKNLAVEMLDEIPRVRPMTITDTEEGQAWMQMMNWTPRRVKQEQEQEAVVAMKPDFEWNLGFDTKVAREAVRDTCTYDPASANAKVDFWMCLNDSL